VIETRTSSEAQDAAGSGRLATVVDASIEREHVFETCVSERLQAEQVLDAKQQREVVVFAKHVQAASLDVLGDQQ
jgi:hypothetical protein